MIDEANDLLIFYKLNRIEYLHFKVKRSARKLCDAKTQHN